MSKKFFHWFIAISAMIFLLGGMQINSYGDEIGTAYYIDSVNGSDDNDGVSDQTPWRTAKNVNEKVFQPGDEILFKRDCVWDEERFAPKGNGTADYPIVISTYGEGEKPLFNGNGEIKEIIYLKNQSHWHISGLEITNDNWIDKVLRGIFVEAKDAGIIENIHITDCVFHDIEGVTWGSALARGNQYECGAIRIYVWDGEILTKYNDVLIENCDFYDMSGMAINMFSDFRRKEQMYDTSTKSDNVIIRNITTNRIGASAIIVGDCNDLLVEHVACYDNGVKEQTNGYPVWICMVPNFPYRCNGVTYQYNETARMIPNGDGQAWDLDWGSMGKSVFQYNYSHENPGGWFLWCDKYDAENNMTELIVRYNISQNDNGSSMRIYQGGNGGAYFYNNTLYDDTGAGFSVDNRYLSNRHFYNNVFWMDKKPVFDHVIEHSHNYYRILPDSVESLDPNYVTGDPKFVDAGTGQDGIETVGGYKLRQDSPLIDSGMTIENHGGYDFFGNEVYQGEPDIGAHEYSGELTTLGIPTVLNDQQTGTEENQFNYVGHWRSVPACHALNSDNHYSNEADAYYTLTFNGTRIKLLNGSGPNAGIAGISIDDGEEYIVDYYKRQRKENECVFDSGDLSEGLHVIKVRVTGEKNIKAGGYSIPVDKVIIYQ